MLPEDVLARRGKLPEKPAGVVLEGPYVRLEPLVIERDGDALFQASNGSGMELGRREFGEYDPVEKIWLYMFDGPFRDAEGFKASLVPYVGALNGLCFCVFCEGKAVGVVNMMNSSPAHLKIELGGIWYSPIVQGMGVNREAVLLMLQHAFDLGYRRVEWKCDARNERSRRAALRLGFKFEGIQECHMIVKGQNRDTAWFRILANEWSPNRFEAGAGFVSDSLSVGQR